MFPLSHMLKSFVRVGTLKVVDAEGRVHVFGGVAPGPQVELIAGVPVISITRRQCVRRTSGAISSGAVSTGATALAAANASRNTSLAPAAAVVTEAPRDVVTAYSCAARSA